MLTVDLSKMITDDEYRQTIMHFLRYVEGEKVEDVAHLVIDGAELVA